MVENPQHIDILGARKDGGADLVMVSPGPLDESPEGQTLLLDKVETYLKYIQSPGFRQQFPAATRENTHVVLLDRERRKAELARITGGSKVTEALLKSAGELLDAAEAYRAAL